MGAFLPVVLAAVSTVFSPSTARADRAFFAADSLSGVVSDSAARPVVGATVTITELNRVTYTGRHGRFAFADVPAGRYRLLVRRLGFAPLLRSVDVSGPTTVTLTLQATALEMDPVTITALRSSSPALSSPMSTAVLDEDALRRQQSVSIAHVLEGVPGVRTMSTGGEIGKPVIRGLSGPRVLVMDDGNRLEDYSWSDEDGPSVDARMADRVEIVRGPASILYGADAIGGVVNVLPAPLPDAIGRSSFVRTGIEAYGASNNNELGTALHGEGASGGFGWRLTAIGRHSEALHTPLGELDNTGFTAVNGQAAVGVRGARGDLMARYVRYGGEFKLLEANGPPPGTVAGTDQGPERKLADDRVQLHGNYRLTDRMGLEVSSQWQRHSLIEVSDEAPGLAPGQEGTAFDLLLNTFSGDLLLHHSLGDHVSGTAGISGRSEVNDTRGPIPLVPHALIRSGGIYALEKIGFSHIDFLVGARGDVYGINADPNVGLGFAGAAHTWNAATGEAGVIVRPIPSLGLAADIGRSWRAPTLFELYANGPQVSDARYLIGVPNLATEAGTSVDASIRWERPRVRAELSGYRHQIGNYVYLTPTSRFKDSLRVFTYGEADARLWGFEGSLEVEALPILTLRGGADGVRGTNLETDDPLPLMPPLRGTVGAQWHSRELAPDHRAWFGAEVELYAKQNRLNPEDIPTNGYTLLDLRAGIARPLLGRATTLDIEIRNALNKSYKSFLSRYKEFALNPGRNIIIRATTGI